MSADDRPVRRGLPRRDGADPAPAPAAEPALMQAVATASRDANARVRIRILIGIGVIVIAALLVLVARWIVTLGFVRDFLVAYTGQYALPAGALVGFPGWVGWQHFFNVFLMVLIIRSGWTVRSERRPALYWSSRRHPERKVSISLWLHQALDVLWLANGVGFIVLLFVTGQWMRVVPTSWAVFPNALSAGLQYVSLYWPTEDGWANYNSLQQLAYFATVFLAAPLAIVTGLRMSAFWPKRAASLNRVYPMGLARALHFPVMLYFVLFIVVHVTLVLATGALRNLNHIYGGSDLVNWVGFGVFVISLVVIVGVWVAIRPVTVAAAARLFGRVSDRP